MYNILGYINEFTCVIKHEFMFISGSEDWIKLETHMIIVISEATNHKELCHHQGHVQVQTGAQHFPG